MLALALSAAIQVTLQARAVTPGELVVLTIALPEHRDHLSVRAFDRAVHPFPIDERTWQAPQPTLSNTAEPFCASGVSASGSELRAPL